MWQQIRCLDIQESNLNMSLEACDTLKFIIIYKLTLTVAVVI